MAGDGDGWGLITRHRRSMVGFVWKSTELNAGTSAWRRSNTILRPATFRWAFQDIANDDDVDVEGAPAGVPSRRKQSSAH
jgi:hypothetical protein